MHRRRENATSGNSSGVKGFTSLSPLDDILSKTKTKALNLKHIKKKAKLDESRRLLKKRVASKMDEDDDNEWMDTQGSAVDTFSSPSINLERIYRGADVINISHAGGELEALEQAVEQELQSGWRQRKQKDSRMRRDRVQVRVDLFQAQMPAAARAYMEWAAKDGGNWAEASQTCSDATDGDQIGRRAVRVVDMFCTYTYECCIEAEDTNLLSSFIRQGLLPCAPSQPSVAITIRTMEAYRTMFMQSPHFTIQPFVKALCDIHGIPFRSYLTQQFSICFDLFFAILADVRALVEQKLERHSETWRLQNACPCCTYRLEGEKELNYSMLFTMDGNDSLKRIARRNAGEQGQLGASKERLDSREGGGGYFLSREEVDEWSKGMLEEILAASDEGTGGNEVNPCADRWKNMMQEMVARMWGIFDETGVFLSLCRHGFVLLACDMVRSGELAKYPLAMVSRLLDVLGKNLGGAYDIGCKFQSTLNKSTIGEKARRLGFKTLVGLFHGHAHNRRCQLKNLLTYVESVGLEDLEGCEHFFSRSNALAPAVRHASIFHRRQAISEFCRHLDAFDTLQSLSDFLCNNYYQALDILDGESAWISSMRSFVGKHEADAEELRKLCEDWRKEEQEYLEGLTKTPEVETLQMEYLKTLRRLVKTQENLNLARDMFVNETPDTILNYGTNTANTNAREAQRRHLWELHQLALKDTQVLEKRLEIRERWIPSSVEWKDTEKLVDNMEYQQALDRLEGLIVSRLFELKGMNKAGQGYKLRQHVGKALKSRSHAIQNATVVDYTFLAEFDLLREGRKDIRDQAWAVPAARNLMDQYYKIERAREEKERLDIEIQRLVTWMQDEEAYLLAKEREVTDPALSYQIQCYRARRTRFNNIHFKKLAKLLKQDGCTATFVAGVGTLSLWRQGSKMAEGTEQEDEEELVEEDIQEEEQVTSTYDDLVLIEGLAALGS